MADYPISIDAVREMLIELRRSLGNERYISIGISMALHQLEGFPQMDAVPVVHGRWENEFGGYRNCSECGCEHPIRDARGFLVDDDYCPHCGAKMDGGADNG